MSEEIKEVDTYKIFRQLEERKKRANPYIFYDKDELIDEILKQEDETEDLQQKVEQLEKEVNEYQKELEKADSITQSCIFQGKQESKISFRNCLNRLEQLENIRKEIKKEIKKYAYTDTFGDTVVLAKYIEDILNKGE